jgi:hypothetical protein
MSCFLIRFTHDRHLELIQFRSFGPLVAKSRIILDRNLVCELLLPSSTYVQSFWSIALSSKMDAWRPDLKSDRAEICRTLDGALIHVLTRLECSRTNSNETCQLTVPF